MTQSTAPSMSDDNALPSDVNTPEPVVMVENSVEDIKKDLYASHKQEQLKRNFLGVSSGAMLGAAFGALAFPVPYLIAGTVAAGFTLYHRSQLKSTRKNIADLNKQLENIEGHTKTKNQEKREELYDDMLNNGRSILGCVGFAASVGVGALAGSIGLQPLVGLAVIGGFLNASDLEDTNKVMMGINKKMGYDKFETPWNNLVSEEVSKEIEVAPLSAKTLREKIQMRAQMAEQNVEGPAPLKPSM